MKIMLGLALSAFFTLLASGCATNHAGQAPNEDPYEPLNRKVYALNDKVDHWVFRPVAKVYDKITPAPVQKGVTNFFANIESTTTLPNDILQGKFVYAVSDGWRFLINSTFGIGGIFDVATHLGIPKHHEDFGLTLANWGITHQAYLMLPILGPSTPRDAIGLLADYSTTPWPYLRPYWLSTTLVTIKTINVRAMLLPADQLVDNAFDPYVFVRSAYLQKRNQEIADNKLTYNQYAARQKNRSSNYDSSPADSLSSDVASMAVDPPESTQTTAATTR